jgi:maleylpyruvate isomerase
MSETTGSARPQEIVERVGEAHERERALIAPLTPADLAVASPLPGWSRAHLLAARLAFTHAALRQIHYASADRTTPFYRGGTDPRAADRAGRDAEVAAHVALPAEELVRAVVAATEVLDRAWSLVGPGDWARSARYRGRGTLLDVLFASWRESEVHIVDYELGRRPSGWSEAFCLHLFGYLERRVPEGVLLELSAEDGRTWRLGSGEPVRVRGPLTDLAAWLAGRSLDGALVCESGELPRIGKAAVPVG